MNPSAQRSKTLQDESRRQQQMDEHIHDLEQEIDRLRRGLREIIHAIEHEQQRTSPRWPVVAGHSIGTARRVLNGKELAVVYAGGGEDD